MPRYAALLRRHPRLVALLVAAVTCVAALGLLRLDFDEDPRAFVHRDDADRELLDELFHDFGADDTDVLAAVEGLDPGDVDAVRLLLDLIDRLRRRDDVISVASPFDARRVGHPLVPLFPRAEQNFTPERLRSAFVAARAHPGIRGQLISADGELFLFVVRLRPSSGTIADTRRQIADLRSVVAEATRGGPLSITLAGHPPLRVDVIAAVRREFYRSLVLSCVATVIVAAVAFRNAAGVVAALAGPAVGLVWTLGWMGWTGQRINGLNTILPSLVFVLGFSDSAHLIVGLQNARAAGLSLADAVTKAIVDVGSACVLMVLTTAVGFGALAIAEIPSVRNFGIAGAMGTILGLAAVLTVMPVLAMLAPEGAWSGRGAARGDDDDAPPRRPMLLERLAIAAVARPRTVVATAILATLGLLAASLRLGSDMRWLEMLPAGDPTIAVTRRCDEKLGGSVLASVVVEWPEGASLDDDGVLDVVAEVQAALQESPDLDGAFSVRDLLEAFSADGSADPAAFRHLRRVPDRHLGRMLREDLRRTVVTARVPDIGAARLLPEFDRVAERLAAIERGHPGYRIRLTGTAVTAARAVYQIIEDTRTSLFTSAAIILAMTVVAFRSLRWGLLCVLPNLFPLLATSALLVAVGEPLRLASAVTFSIALGLADDSAIHFVSAFLRARRDGLGVRPALERVLSTSGRAMVIAALTLAAGMAPLLFCRLGPLRTFAALAIFEILAALVADFFILPSVLACFGGEVVPCPADGGVSPPASGADTPDSRGSTGDAAPPRGGSREA